MEEITEKYGLEPETNPDVLEWMEEYKKVLNSK